jgi:TrmH family RNA methyltransferase
MVSKNTIKLIKSLAHKKFRLREKLFLVEGDKNVSEVLNSKIKVEKLFATKTFLEVHKKDVNNVKLLEEANKDELKQASILKSPQNSIALCRLPESKKLPETFDSDLWIYLDDIQDPGNLGTIIRICDWFGIERLFCSPKTVDIFNPKVIQSSMGSFCRIDVTYSEFEDLATIANNEKIAIIGAFLEGSNIYKQKLPQKALLVLGNEGNGISKIIENRITQKLRIPEFNQNVNSAESLNVGVASAIFCSEFKRQKHFPDYSK